MSRIRRSILYKERVRDKTVKGARNARGQCRRGFARSSLSTRVIFITLISPLIIVVQRAVTLELEQQSPLYHRRRKRGKRRHEGRSERGRERLIDALRFLGSLARCWARHAISRGDARVKREQRAFGVESFPLFRGGEERKRARERQKKTDREKEQTHPPGMQVGG